MFNFNLKKSLFASAISARGYFRLMALLRKILLSLLVLLFLVLLWPLLIKPFPEKVMSYLFGLPLLLFIFFVVAALQEFFYDSYLKRTKPKAPLSQVAASPEKYNLADFMSFEAARALWPALGWAKRSGLLPLSTPCLLYFLLRSREAASLFLRSGLQRGKVRRELKVYLLENRPLRSRPAPPEALYTKGFQETFLIALKQAADQGRPLIEVGDLLYGLAKTDSYFKNLLIKHELKAEDFSALTRFSYRLKQQREKRKRFWEADNLALLGSIGKEFAAGYTVTLDKYSRDVVLPALKKRFQEVAGHEKEIEEVERILSRTTLNNVLLVGRPGSGRKKIVDYFAVRSYLGQSEPLLNHKRIILLNLPSLIAQIETLEKAEEVLDRIFKEVREAGNVILVIEEFHNYVSPEPRPGILNIAGLLSSYLDKSDFQIIALTSYVGLHEEIEQNPSLLNYFNKVEVRELTEEETLKVLEDYVAFFETRYKKIILYPTLKQIVSLAARYLPDTAFPKKALDLLDEVMVASTHKPDHPFVLPSDADEVVTEKTEIPVGKIEEKEREVLLTLEDLIHRRIINQDEAVGDVSEALRRARTEITIRKGPMGTFLFLGPTGVGKTETSKALAAIYFGSESRMIRLDMSEFQGTEDIRRLLGGAGHEGLLTTKVREDPFSLVLLDEIEKSHPNILNLFLQVLDEGFLTDGMGRKVNFRNTIIIGTSNAASDFIWKTHGEVSKNELMLYLIDKKIFRPEFLNRFDSVVVFRPLSRSNLLDIADLLLRKLSANMKEKEISLLFPPPVKQAIVELSYKPAFGAREMRRVIQEKIENLLAEALLKKAIKRGDRVKVAVKSPTDFKLLLEG